jgi:hypothetical protein
VVEQAEVLKHDPDATTQGRHRIARERSHIVAELGNQASRRLHRQKQKAQ